MFHFRFRCFPFWCKDSVQRHLPWWVNGDSASPWVFTFLRLFSFCILILLTIFWRIRGRRLCCLLWNGRHREHTWVWKELIGNSVLACTCAFVTYCFFTIEKGENWGWATPAKVVVIWLELIAWKFSCYSTLWNCVVPKHSKWNCSNKSNHAHQLLPINKTNKELNKSS